jgi:maltodextrin utilization protein YvdJ
LRELNQLFKASLFNLSGLVEAKNIKFGKTLLYTIFLCIIVAVPITNSTWNEMSHILADIKTIGEKLPDFEIKDKKLETTHKGFVYQTNSIIFTFDPEDKRSNTDLVDDASGNVFAVALKKNEMVAVFPETVRDTYSGSDQGVEIKYDANTFGHFTGKTVKNAIEKWTRPGWLLALVYLVSFLPALMNVIFAILLMSFVAVLYNAMSRIQMKFSETLRIVLFTMTAPVIVGTILSLFMENIDLFFIESLGTLILYFAVVKNLRPKPPKPEEENNNH